MRVLVMGAGSTLGHACCANSTGSTGSSRRQAAAAARGAIGRGTISEDGGESGAAVVAPQGFPAGTAQAPGSLLQQQQGCGLPDERFSQMCLRRLALLASRASDGQAGSMHAVLLEVAQIALPQLIQRCRRVLQAYAQHEHAAAVQELQALQQQVAQHRACSAGGFEQQEGVQVSHAECAVIEAVTQREQQGKEREEQQRETEAVCLQQQCLVEEVLCVLQVLLELQLDAAVFECLLEQQPSVAACLAAVQHAQQVHQDIQQQQAGGSAPQQQQQPQQMLPPKQQQLQATVGDQGGRRSSTLGAAAAGRVSDPGGVAAGGGDSSSGGSSRHQGHLLLLYKELADCAGCTDRRVGVLVRAALQAAGKQLAL